MCFRNAPGPSPHWWPFDHPSMTTISFSHTAITSHRLAIVDEAGFRVPGPTSLRSIAVALTPDERLQGALGKLWYFSNPEESSTAPPHNYQEVLVEAARYEDATWRQIADAVGLTEQGVRYRYRHLLGSPGRPLPPDA